jgi:hypothetical protein
MTQSISVLAMSVRSAGAIARGRAVGFDGAQIAAANAALYGIARFPAAAAGEDVTLDVMGTAIVEAGAAVALGAALATDAQGRLVTHSTGPIVGRALQAATAAGQFFEALLTP